MALSPLQWLHRGHPTRPGIPDEDPDIEFRRPGASPGNGVPGIPHLRPAPDGVPGPLPGPTPSGPVQPGAPYGDGSDRGDKGAPPSPGPLGSPNKPRIAEDVRPPD